MRWLVLVWLLGCRPSTSACSATLEARIAEDLRALEAGERIAETDEQTWTPEQRAVVERADAIERSRTRAVDGNDLAILDRALALLASEQVWNRADDRTCPAQAATLSLFCALQRASIAVLGHYEHRRAALQEVRFVVDERTDGRDYHHRLRDYNNDPTTTLADVRSAIALARQRVAARMCR